MRDSTLKLVNEQLELAGLESTVVTFEPDDGAASFDLVMQDVHQLTMKIEGYPDEVVRFIVNEPGLADDIVNSIVTAVLMAVPPDNDIQNRLAWSVTHEVIAMYDESPTIVAHFLGATGVAV